MTAVLGMKGLVRAFDLELGRARDVGDEFVVEVRLRVADVRAGRRHRRLHVLEPVAVELVEEAEAG